MSFNLQYFPYCYLKERGKRTKKTNKQQNKTEYEQTRPPVQV